MGKALALKKEGNAFYKQNEFKQALKAYSQIFIHLGMNSSTNVSSIFGIENKNKENSEQMKLIRGKINELRLSAFNNMSMVQLKQGNFSKVIANCTNAIQSDAYNFKALLRRARAYRHLKDRQNAIKDLKFFQQYYKYDLQIKNELKLLEMGDFETDNIVINEAEEKEKEKKERANEAKIKKEKSSKYSGNN